MISHFFTAPYKISNAQGATDKDTKDNKNGSTGKQYGSFTVVKEYDVSHLNPYAGATSTFDTVKLQEAFGSGEFKFSSGTHIEASEYSSLFASWLSEDSMFGVQRAFSKKSAEQIAEFDELNVIEK